MPDLSAGGRGEARRGHEETPDAGARCLPVNELRADRAGGGGLAFGLLKTKRAGG
jgi:hypothetical protein